MYSVHPQYGICRHILN